jgi:hypothetical protein
MKEFRISEETAKKTMKSRVVSQIPMFIFAGAAGVYLAITQNEGPVPHLTLILAITIPVLTIAGYIGMRMGIKSGVKSLMKNIYRLTENEIEWHTPSGKTVIIDYDKIDHFKTQTRGLLIKSKNKRILIPRELDNFNEITGLIRENS